MPGAREAEAAFVERITAGATHDLRNVLAIVKESAGLIEDLLHAAARAGSLDQEKVLWALGRIRSQVGRGAALVGALNRFAHSLGESSEPVDLRHTVEQAVALCERFARQREVRVVVRPEGAGLVEAGALPTFMALSVGIEACAEQLDPGAAVVIAVETWQSEPAVRFAAEDGAGATLPVGVDTAVLNARLARVGAAESSVTAVEGGGGFFLVFPVGDR